MSTPQSSYPAPSHSPVHSPATTPPATTPAGAPEYPPEPWHLTANAYLSLWTVPAAELPRLPATQRPVTVGGAAFVVTAWFDYLPSGQLSYRELLAAVAVRGGRTPTGTITEIWVDSPSSQAGGRELWAVPKDLADLQLTHGRTVTATASTAADWVATAAFSPRPSLPARLPMNVAIRQQAACGPRTAAVRSTAKPGAATAAWNINPDGPLGYLAGRTPVVSAHLSDARIRFGA
ncbi:acetoacetate decarboxylase family protein [Prauserella halophila]|uniref:Acetoacetate decarboxylase family protein n=1 Tax=Prauserella halophila TaxID=185641 RepID=A0ABP4GL08_9PSEU|nr:acetoacetate decarboxylase family protein [Prauserella halophila]MCP2237458.1 Acetoacetate decarboxylase (ADC) [Prauserella halophila]